jgi:hypothetical protein
MRIIRASALFSPLSHKYFQLNGTGRNGIVFLPNGKKIKQFYPRPKSGKENPLITACSVSFATELQKSGFYGIHPGSNLPVLDYVSNLVSVINDNDIANQIEKLNGSPDLPTDIDGMC